jgi:FkbM family methyltransferase
MTMISYAQNGEDVMLMRALGDVAGGFYIDVGAADPTIVSVTRAFYERGWHGVNVEPTVEHHRRLGEARQRDVNLSQPVSDHVAEELFYFCEHPDLSTLIGDVAAAAASGGQKSESRVLQTTTLAEICRRFAPPVIHFLKIDVEGAEERVLRGADFRNYRPWIVVVEATHPNTQIFSHATWEPILMDSKYRFVWFDGLNRFYLAEEKLDTLQHHFDAPINVFDDFVRYDPALESLAAELAAARAMLEPLREAAAAAERRQAAALSDTRALAETAAHERASAVSRAEAAEAAAALLDARMRSSDALAQAAAANAQVAETQVFAAKARLGDLQHEIHDTRRRHDDLLQREEATRAMLAAQRSEAAAQRSEAAAHLALVQRALDERAASHDGLRAELDAERARALALEQEAGSRLREIVALGQEIARRDAPEPAPEPAPEIREIVLVPARRPTLRRRVATGLYGWTLRPLLRPLAWRGRSFLVAGLRQALDEQTASPAIASGARNSLPELLGEIRSRQDRILDMVHRVDDLAAEQRAQQHRSFAEIGTRAGDTAEAVRRVETALSKRDSSELGELAASMETALLTLASAGRIRGR